jgi:hypothetical protein
MKLSDQDAELFFNLMWSLQFYVNSKLDILPEFTTLEEFQLLPSELKIDVRDALYDNIEIIDSYIQENPQNFTNDELDIVNSWKKFVRGEFFIERLLKKYAIFIGNDEVYGVLALHELFEDVIPHLRPPYFVKAVLLPFQGKIIYDGVLITYNIHFGSGMRFDFKETYMRAKQNGRIIVGLDPIKHTGRPAGRKKPSKDWGPKIDEISNEVKVLRSSSGAPPIHSPAFSLAKASVELAKTAVHTPEDFESLWKALEKVERALSKTETILFRSEDYPRREED